MPKACQQYKSAAPYDITGLHDGAKFHAGITGFGSAIINLCVWIGATCAGINSGAYLACSNSTTGEQGHVDPHSTGWHTEQSIRE